MSEIPKHRVPNNSQLRREIQSRRRKEARLQTWLSTRADGENFLDLVVVPHLSETFGTRTVSRRGLRGHYGETTRSVKRSLDVLGDKDHKDQIVFSTRVSRSRETRSDRDLAILALDLEVSILHVLQEDEVIMQWPLIDSVSAGDDLVASAAATFTDDIDDFDVDDPSVISQVSSAQADMLDDYDGDDLTESSMVERVYGSEIVQYFDRTLRVVSGKRPILMYGAGYMLGDKMYPIRLENEASLMPEGNTVDELFAMTSLQEGVRHEIDSVLIKEFGDALRVLGMIKKAI